MAATKKKPPIEAKTGFKKREEPLPIPNLHWEVVFKNGAKITITNPKLKDAYLGKKKAGGRVKDVFEFGGKSK